MGNQKVIEICTAYESGFGQGMSGRSLGNPYSLSSRDAAEAWAYGLSEGLKRRSREGDDSSLHGRLIGGADACRSSANRHAGSEVGRMFDLLDKTMSEAAARISDLSRCACGLSVPHEHKVGKCTPGWRI